MRITAVLGANMKRNKQPGLLIFKDKIMAAGKVPTATSIGRDLDA